MSGPFTDLSSIQRNKIFDLLNVHIYKFNKNEEILATIKGGNFIAIILSGEAKIINIEYNGDEIIVENLYKDSVFGTNISLINDDNSEIIAKEDCEILLFDYNSLTNIRNIKYSYFNKFFHNLFDIINTKSKELNERLRILEKKQIRDKLLEFFEIEYKKSHSRIIYLNFTLKDLADYIAVNRSAMFRELKHLKDDKLIDVKDKRITLLYK